MRSTLLNNATWSNLVSHLGAIGDDPVWRIEVSAVQSSHKPRGNVWTDEFKQKSISMSKSKRCQELYRAVRGFLLAVPGYTRHKYQRDGGVYLVRRAVRLASHGIVPSIRLNYDERHDRISLSYQIIGSAEVNS
jgi:hypothetical protein